jgi:hypothetical protein
MQHVTLLGRVCTTMQRVTLLGCVCTKCAACYTSWPSVHNNAACSVLHVHNNAACYTSWLRVQHNAACYTSWPRVQRNAACYTSWTPVQHIAACYSSWPQLQHIAACLLFYLVISLGRVVCMPLSFSHDSSISPVLALYFSLVPPQNYTIMITGQILAVANGINGRRHSPRRTTRVDPTLITRSQGSFGNPVCSPLENRLKLTVSRPNTPCFLFLGNACYT